MYRDLVERRHCILEGAYKEGLALAQLVPGPLAAQLVDLPGLRPVSLCGATLPGLPPPAAAGSSLKMPSPDAPAAPASATPFDDSACDGARP